MTNADAGISSETPPTPMVDPRVVALLRGGNFGVIATLGADGAPQTTAVWVDWDGRHVLVATTTDTVKYRNIDRDPRVAITIIDKDDPYFEANLRGTVEEVRPDGVVTIDRLSRRYYGVYPYPYHKRGETWVTLAIRLDKVRTNK